MTYNMLMGTLNPTHSFTHSLTHSLTHSFTHSVVCCLQSQKRHIIGYFDSDTSPDFTTYQKVASVLRDDCSFHAAIGSGGVFTILVRYWKNMLTIVGS